MKHKTRKIFTLFFLLFNILIGTSAFAVGDPQHPDIASEKFQNDDDPANKKWKLNFYGFAEMDMIADSTRSFNDLAGNSNIAQPNTLAGDNGRLTFGVRNSRIGFKMTAPDFHKIKSSAVLEFDFLGNQPPNVSESAYFTSPSFRIRLMAFKMETPYVEFLIGQYWQLFGWQPYFHPNTVEIQGVPGQVYQRAPQFRITHTFKTDPVNVDLAVAAARPPQRDSFTPDGQGAIKVSFNNRKGIHTAGATGTAVDPMAFGLSGDIRRFSLPAFTANPTSNVSTTGWAGGLDVFIPIIPATLEHRENGLTFTGSYVRGNGTADFYTNLTGGISFPPSGLSPAPTYTPDVDNGLVTFNSSGQLHAIGWQSFILGLQYYLPPSGRVWISTNYSQMNSHNMSALATSPSTTFNASRWADGNIFWDITHNIRVGGEFAWFHQDYLNNVGANDYRGQLSFFYLFDLPLLKGSKS